MTHASLCTGIASAKYGFGAYNDLYKKYVAFGFTLTGHDELEPNASTNAERIAAMKKLYDAGFKTWASIEPVIDFNSSEEMISKTRDFCDLYKIGLKSDKKYNQWETKNFINHISSLVSPKRNKIIKIYFKDSLLKVAGINREDLPKNCVGRDYDIFSN